VEQQLIGRNPCDVFKKRLPKVERREMATLTAEQSQVLLTAIRHTRIYWPVLIALASGPRRGEILALRWRNVDLDRGAVGVVESLEQTKAGLRAKAPKSEKARAITLPAFAVDELRRLKREQAQSLLALGIRQTRDTLLCARADGEPMQPRSLTHEFTRLIGRTKSIPRVRFHDLRHSHATQLLYGSPEIFGFGCTFISGHGSITDMTYRAGEGGAQATAQSERIKPWSAANRCQAISQASIMCFRSLNIELASQWLRR
jgi:integrase